MKLYSLGAVVALFFIQSFAQAQDVQFTVVPLACDASVQEIALMEFDGFNFTPFQKQALENGKVTFSLPETLPRVYYVGTGTGNMMPIILGSEKEVTFTTTCRSFRTGTASGSILNEEYKSLKSQLQLYKKTNRNAQRQMLQAEGDEKTTEIALQTMAQVDKQRLVLLDSLKRTKPFLANVAEFNTYLSYQWYGEGFKDELNYFVNMYFNYVTWESAYNHYNPWVYEGVKAYTEVLSKTGIPNDQHVMALNAVLSKVPKETRTYKLAYGGIIAGLQNTKHENLAVFAKRFIDEFKEKDPKTTEELSKKLKKMQAFVIGGIAPDFTQNTPEGKPLALSSLRGKVVLLDFWASWCGPCRRENPNVVKAYDKYKAQGFDILSISLDSKRDRWLAAIEKDNLKWHHVSDLKGWKNEVAKMYGVTSIPATILLDAEGRILARNLRGPALEAKLEEVLGK